MYLDTQELSPVDRASNNTILGLAERVVHLTEEIERLLAIIEELKDDDGNDMSRWRIQRRERWATDVGVNEDSHGTT